MAIFNMFSVLQAFRETMLCIGFKFTLFANTFCPVVPNYTIWIINRKALRTFCPKATSSPKTFPPLVVSLPRRFPPCRLPPPPPPRPHFSLSSLSYPHLVVSLYSFSPQYKIKLNCSLELHFY